MTDKQKDRKTIIIAGETYRVLRMLSVTNFLYFSPWDSDADVMRGTLSEMTGFISEKYDESEFEL